MTPLEIGVLRECSVGTFVVISIPETCSKYFCMFTFRMFANKFLLSDVYNHSKKTLDFMQTTTDRNCKEKETCVYLKRWRMAK